MSRAGLATTLLTALALTAPACVDDEFAGAGDGAVDDNTLDDDSDDDAVDDDDDAVDDDGDAVDDLHVDHTVQSLKPAPAGGFRFARTVLERRASVPIKDESAWRVIYSIELVDLDPAEKIAARGEVQLTTCQASDLGDTPCKRITPFDPKYKTKLILADGPGDASGENLGDPRDVTCSHFKHHCALALGEAQKGGLSGTRYLNLVVAATGDDPGSKDLMIVDDSHGGLYATRIGAGADAKGDTVALKDVSPDWMKLNMANVEPREPHLTFQVKLTGAKPGEILDLDARIVAVTDGAGSKPAGCSGARDPLISHQVFVSTGKSDPEKSKLATLTAKNGSNCRLDDQCTYRKSGAAVLPDDTPGTVFVSVVSWGGRSCSAPNDRWKVGGASEVTVRRRKK